MPNPPFDVDQIVRLYWEADRSAVRERYERLFGSGDAEARRNRASDAVAQTEQLREHALRLRDIPEASIHATIQAWADALFIESADREQFMQECQAPGAQPLADVSALSKIYTDDPEDDRWHLYGLQCGFGRLTVSQMIYPVRPQVAFPMTDGFRDTSYGELRRILSALGIDYDDSRELSEPQVWTNLSAAVERYRCQHRLEQWQIWATVHDLGPRLLPEPPESTGLRRIWIVATNDEAGEFENIDAHDSSVVGTWAIHKGARRGDLALMYCVSPRSALVSVYEVMEDAHFDPFGGWNDYRAKISGKVAIPWIIRISV